MDNKIVVRDHWRGELTKLRCWLDGFKTGRTSLPMNIPGEDVLRQIILAIDNDNAEYVKEGVLAARYDYNNETN